MKRTNLLSYTIGWCCIGLCMALVTPRAVALGGVGDTTVIVDDLTDMWKWPRELEQWTQMIQNTRDQVAKADALIQLVGDPDKMVHELVDSVPALLKPVDDAIGLQTRKDALRFSQEVFALGKVGIKTYNDANKVGAAYEAFGEKVKRDPKRYAHLEAQEAMYARYKNAVENAETVEKSEMAVQKKALEKLSHAHSESDVAVVNATIAASKQRLDLAQQKALQAKAELDAFRGQLVAEETLKKEADREWAEHVIEQMRQKALAAYRAQVGDTTDTPAH